jgi:hypothetical protein
MLRSVPTWQACSLPLRESQAITRRGRMQERDERFTVVAQQRDERGWRDDARIRASRSPQGLAVAIRRPTKELIADHEPRLAALEYERAVGQLVERGGVETALSRSWRDALPMELRIDRVGSALVFVERGPDFDQEVVVRAAAERAGPMPGRERRRLVQEEELREAARLHERPAVPAAELEPTCDPALDLIAPTDASVVVVEAATVAVDKPSGGIRNQLSQGCDSILERHSSRSIAGRLARA